MKKIYLKLSICIIAFLSSLLVFVSNKNSKFYLDSIHYNTNEQFISIESENLSKLMEDKKSFVIFTYLPYCTFSIPCDVIFETFLNENDMSFYSIPYDKLNEVKYFDEVKYAPSVILVNKGVIVEYLDANSDNDLKKYQDAKEFSSWIEKYVYLKNN